MESQPPHIWGKFSTETSLLFRHTHFTFPRSLYSSFPFSSNKQSARYNYWSRTITGSCETLSACTPNIRRQSLYLSRSRNYRIQRAVGICKTPLHRDTISPLHIPRGECRRFQLILSVHQCYHFIRTYPATIQFREQFQHYKVPNPQSDASFFGYDPSKSMGIHSTSCHVGGSILSLPRDPRQSIFEYIIHHSARLSKLPHQQWNGIKTPHQSPWRWSRWISWIRSCDSNSSKSQSTETTQIWWCEEQEEVEKVQSGKLCHCPSEI